jgi:hypothetical protein
MRKAILTLRLAAAVVAAAAAVGCVSQGVPMQKGYSTVEGALYDRILLVLRDMGGQIVAESPRRDTVTAHFSAETAKVDFLMEVSLAHHLEDVTYVQVSVWSELETMSREDQDYWRERFYDALDVVADPARQGGRRPPDSGPAVPR